MQEVGGSSPPISTGWVRLSVFSACSNLWLLHAFFCFGYFWGNSGFYFLECVDGVQLSFYCPSLQSSLQGSSLGVGIFLWEAGALRISFSDVAWVALRCV